MERSDHGLQLVIHKRLPVDGLEEGVATDFARPPAAATESCCGIAIQQLQDKIACLRAELRGALDLLREADAAKGGGGGWQPRHRVVAGRPGERGGGAEDGRAADECKVDLYFVVFNNILFNNILGRGQR